MTLESIRKHCLSHPDATEQIQWGADLVFKIGGKMFCVACTEPIKPPKVAMSFKCDDETFGELVERDGVIPAPYLARAKWVALQEFDTLDASELRPLITRAYEIVSSKLPKRKAKATTKDTKSTKTTKSEKGNTKAKRRAAQPVRRKAQGRTPRGR